MLTIVGKLISKKENLSQTKIVIQPSKGWIPLDFKGLWEYRELLYFLTWRDIKVRYKQTVLGAFWAILQPFMTMVVFSVLFGKFAGMPSDGRPYPLFSYSGLLLWTYFSSSVSNSGNSLVGNANLITKVYFPRFIVPLSASLSALVDYGIAMGILFLMMIYYHVPLTLNLLALPLVVVFTFLASAGFGLLLASLNIKYRDIRHALPFLIQMLLYTTPVIYPSSLVPEKYRWLFMLNPMSGLVEIHRACVLGQIEFHWNYIVASICMTLIICWIGFFHFRRTERFFADVI